MYPSTASTCLLDIDYWTCYITLRDLYLGSVYSVLIAYLKWLYTANLLTVIGAYFDSVHQLESPDCNFDEKTDCSSRKALNGMPFSGRTLNRVVDDVMDETAIRRVINDTWVYIIWVHGRNTSRVALNDQRIEQKTIISGCKTAKKSNANSCFTNTCTMKIACTGSSSTCIRLTVSH